MVPEPVSPPSDADRPQRVVVLGGGFGGLAFCKELPQAAFSITLVDRQNHHLFQPLLYQVATAGLSATDIAQPIRSILAGQENVRVIMAEVHSVDLAARRVVLGDAALDYDVLVIALGARSGYFGHPEWEQHAQGLKSLEDAMRIRREVLLAYEKAETANDPQEVRRLLSTIVVGGGPTGVEMAGALAELAHKALKRDFRRIDPSQASVILIEAGPRLLGSFPEDLSRYAEQRLTQMGVTVKTSCRVQEVGPGMLVADRETIPASTIVWAAGVEGSAVARLSGLPVDRSGRVPVEPDCSLPGHPDVFVIGDLAQLTDRNGVNVPGVSPAAMQMGRHVAGILREEQRLRKLGRPVSASVPRAAFAYFDKGSMATIGRSAAVAISGPLKFRGFTAWLMWLFVHLLFLIGFRNKISVFLNWVHAYVTYKRGARLITSPPPKDR